MCVCMCVCVTICCVVVTEPENNPKNGMQWVMYDTVWEMSLLNNWSSCKLSERQLLGTINSVIS